MMVFSVLLACGVAYTVPCGEDLRVGLMGFPVGLMGVGIGRPQGNDAGLFQPAAASAETIRAEPSRAISFLSSAFSACSCPFSRARMA